MNVRHLVDAALENATLQADEGNAPSLIHRNRSKHFVEALAAQFRTHGQGKFHEPLPDRHCKESMRQGAAWDIFADPMLDILCGGARIQLSRQSFRGLAAKPCSRECGFC